MKRAVSTHVFLHQRLHTGHLDALKSAGAQSIEIFAARHHFDYTDRSAVKEIATWFRDNGLRATLHQPLFDPSTQWSRHVAPTINLIDVEKSRRIDAMDEVKRALEAAEQIDIDHIVLHLGTSSDTWSERTLDHSLTAIEHVKAFAHPLMCKTLVETLHNDVTTPEHLLEILRVGHFSTVGICLDLGHVHLPGSTGVKTAFELLSDRILELHIHDNAGEHDEHLWPGEGTIDWQQVRDGIAALKQPPVGVLEIAYDPELSMNTVTTKAATAFQLLNV
ncbi:MAG: sugar phosphate isomerase/epimerase [Acidobacteria bacterium]|nr:sugar phosphate isomerase/epimerase [Acidobacteriota bacterium]